MPPNNTHSLLLISIASSLIILFFLLPFLYLYFSLRRRRSPTLPFDFPSAGAAASSIHRFRRRDLRSATTDFSPSRLLGRGSSASVFRGLLPDGKSVAVKTLGLTLEAGSSSPSKSDLEFKNELHVLSTMRPSPFVVNLIGFCDRGACRMLVYEYMPNGSLQQALFSSKNCVELSWDRRFGIILDVAMGLEFLHFGCNPTVVHGDIKPSNVLLGLDFRAKIADFGLAKVKNDCDDGFVGQDVGLFPSQELCSDFEFDFAKAVRGCSSSGNFEGRVRCNPIASLEGMMKGKEATVITMDGEGVCNSNSLECSKELNDGDWWWKQEGSGELNSRDYVREWIGSQICTLISTEDDLEAGFEAHVGSKRKDEKGGDSFGKKSVSAKEWWKEEYFEEMSKKSKCNKRLNSLNWFHKSTSNNTYKPNNNIDREMNVDISFRKGSWKKSKKRSKLVGSEIFGGDLFSKELSSTATSMRGTICYVAPEQSGGGQFMEKGDIYSFGVLILVIISGRRPLHVLSSPMKLERANLISWCRQLASSGNVLDSVDERLRDSYNKEQATLCINLALLCLQKMPELRPDSEEIVNILKGEMDLPIVPFEFSPSPNSKMLSNKRRKATRDPESHQTPVQNLVFQDCRHCHLVLAIRMNDATVYIPLGLMNRSKSKERDLASWEADLKRREHLGFLLKRNWPSFFSIIHHNISKEIPIHAQRLQHLTFASWLVNQGHCHPKVMKALVEQAGRFTLSSRAFYNDKFLIFAEYLTHFWI